MKFTKTRLGDRFGVPSSFVFLALLVVNSLPLSATTGFRLWSALSGAPEGHRRVAPGNPAAARPPYL